MQGGPEGRSRSLFRYAEESKRLGYGLYQCERSRQTSRSRGTAGSVGHHTGVLLSAVETTKGAGSYCYNHCL